MNRQMQALVFFFGARLLSAQTLEFRNLLKEPFCPRVEGEAEKLLSSDQRRRPSAIQDPSFKPAEEVHVPAGQRKDASGFGFQDAKGKLHTLDELKGKTTIIGFWSPTCDPSMQQMGELAELQQKGAQFGFNVLPVHFSEWPTVFTHLARFPKFFSKTEVYKVGVGDHGMKNLGETINALPAIFLIDGEGKIAYTWTGYFPGRLVDRLKILLKESKTTPPQNP